MSSSTTLECWSVRIHGHVQGVGYRDTCAHQARRLGVTGWVRNRSDGTVEALMLGPKDELFRMQAWLRHGPPHARVTAVDVQRLDAPFPIDDLAERFEKRATV